MAVSALLRQQALCHWSLHGWSWSSTCCDKSSWLGEIKNSSEANHTILLLRVFAAQNVLLNSLWERVVGLRLFSSPTQLT